MREVILVRHAQASFGAADYDALSDLGHEQAAALARVLPAAPALVVTGRMRRHRETAAGWLDAAKLGGCDEVDAAWDEYDHSALLRALDPRYADHAGIAEDILREADPSRAFQRILARALARWASGEHDAEYAEPWPAFRARVANGLQRLRALGGPAGTAVVVTSGGPILASIQQALDVPAARAFELGHALANASITRLASTATGWRLAAFNETGHVPGRLLTFR